MSLLIGGALALTFLDPPWSIVVISGLVAVEVGELFLWRWAWRQRPRSGTEAIVGETGVLSSERRVRIRGTSYPARVLDGRPGDRVRVEAVEGMTLVVRTDRNGG